MRLSLQTRERASALRAQILNLTGIRKAGFFLQYDHVADTEKQRPHYPEVAQLFEGRRPDFERLLDAAAGAAPALCDDTVAPAINWNAVMFPPLDTLFTYTILKRSGAAKVLEIGSGASTRAIVRGLAASTRPGQLTCIDPAPRQDISGLGARHIRRVMRESDVSLVDDFAANDVLFIDSSHYMLPGTDVDLQFNRIFPRLKPGVLVHVHDIFLPNDYPPHWKRRWYSEQNALVGWILSGFFEVVLAGNYVTATMKDSVTAKLGNFPPLARSRKSGSLWMRKT